MKHWKSEDVFKVILSVLLIPLLAYCSLTEENGGHPIDRLDPVGVIDYSPSWSPTGVWIVFTHGPSTREGTGVYRIKSDGSDEALIIPGGFDPSWSFNGESLVLKMIGDNELYTTNISGTGLVRLTSDGIKKKSPSWHPNSMEVLYSVIGEDSIAGIWTHNIQTNMGQRLSPIFGIDPKWNPDGSAIAFIRSNISGQYLSLLEDPFTDFRDLLSYEEVGGGLLHCPSFSPDGLSIAFYPNQTASLESCLWIFDLESNQVSKVLSGGKSPSWSPDGQYLVFVRHVVHSQGIEGNGYLWILSLNSGEMHQLTRN